MGWHELKATFGYRNSADQEVYLVKGANTYAAPASIPKRYLVLHHTAGVDSRQYLLNNPGRVSSHYLVGDYDANRARRIYKYASEIRECTHTQGLGSIGGYALGNINDVCVSIEVEGPPIDPALRLYVAKLARSIIDGWAALGVSLTMLRHRDIDHRKPDPAMDWTKFCQEVYWPDV